MDASMVPEEDDPSPWMPKALGDAIARTEAALAAGRVWPVDIEALCRAIEAETRAIEAGAAESDTA